MRESVAAIALIQRVEAGQRQWLAQWNGNWRRYSFVGGHKRPEETFRQCAVREIAEELNLTEGDHYVVASEPLARLGYTAWSEGARQNTRYTMELFDVQLTDAARRIVDADPHNRWLTDREIRRKCCDDGQPVSETMERVLVKADLLFAE